MRILRLIIALLVVISCRAISAQTNSLCPYEKDSFGEECFNGTVPIRRDVVAAIFQTEEGKMGAAMLTEEQRQHPESLFKAQALHLVSGGEQDLIVMGSGPMSGADNAWFWIVRKTPSGPEAVLWIGALGVSILRRSTHGLRDIESGWCSAAFCETKRYRFNGKMYVQTWNKVKQQKP
jgi:hypothetical protein